ncbi:ABC transporter permease [Azoarcus sp. L1K30]|uniref:ABC transporter permease n=1 Tax=Azoarcus sp. L1K30 TaxID=2820277 RepID=UPI001B820C5D|nr:ABC transporter permease [Azoarcus sp. L1K30]MBR0566018.1 ABC transporter permease [Azoarcus sp. L1K30]
MKPFLWAAWSLVMRDFRVRFRRTLLGVVWFLVPLFTLVSMALFVGQDLGLYREGQSKNYLVQLLAGLLLWQLVADTWLEPMRLARRANMLLRSVVFDARVLLGAGALSALVAFALKLPVLIAALIWFQVPFTASISWFPLAVCILLAAGAAMACFTLPLSLALLDVRYAMPFVQYALLLATPVFYTAPQSGPLALINHINPFSYMIVPFRDMLTGTMPDASAVLGLLFLVCLFLGLGLYYFQAKVRLAAAYIGH